jgi:hypothetical protein
MRVGLRDSLDLGDDHVRVAECRELGYGQLHFHDRRGLSYRQLLIAADLSGDLLRRPVRHAQCLDLQWVRSIFFSAARLALITFAFASTVVWSAVSHADPGDCTGSGNEDAIEGADHPATRLVRLSLAASWPELFPLRLAYGAPSDLLVAREQHRRSPDRGHRVSATAAEAAEANSWRRADSAVVHPRCSHSRPASESPAITTSPNGMER